MILLSFSCFLCIQVATTLSAVAINNDSEQTCDNPLTCFAQPPEDAKYASKGGYFPSNHFLPVPVLSIRSETQDSKIITFGLPLDKSLGHTISSAIVMQVPPTESSPKAVMRPYNPISSPSQKGSFELLIKLYLPDGICSQYVANLQVGDLVSFKQTKTNIKKFQLPFEGVKKITMLAGGTGIAPMVQALPSILEQGDAQVILLYGNKTPKDIMLKKELDSLTEQYGKKEGQPAQFVLHYIVGEAQTDNHTERVTNDDGSSTYYESGWIDEDKIKRLAFLPENENSISTVAWICGVDDMYKTLAGSRMKAISEGSALHNLGYSDNNVWRS